MILGIILAAGKGSRFNSVDTNKTAVNFLGKPLIQYGVDLYSQVCDKTMIVTGAYEASVKQAVNGTNLEFVRQKELIGTGDATRTALEAINLDKRPSYVFVGYGDHLMTYKPHQLKEMLTSVQEEDAAISLVAAEHQKPSTLGWGRIVQDSDSKVQKIVEQKDATDEEKRITFLNVGFYCFEYNFLSNYIGQLEKSPVSEEYYLTDMVEIAVQAGKKVLAYPIPFQEVGYGINTREHLKQAELLVRSNMQKS